jgi:hypothetical protein
VLLLEVGTLFLCCSVGVLLTRRLLAGCRVTGLLNSRRARAGVSRHDGSESDCYHSLLGNRSGSVPGHLGNRHAGGDPRATMSTPTCRLSNIEKLALPILGSMFPSWIPTAVRSVGWNLNPPVHRTAFRNLVRCFLSIDVLPREGVRGAQGPRARPGPVHSGRSGRGGSEDVTVSVRLEIVACVVLRRLAFGLNLIHRNSIKLRVLAGACRHLAGTRCRATRRSLCVPLASFDVYPWPPSAVLCSEDKRRQLRQLRERSRQ